MSKMNFWYDKDSLDKASDAVDKELSNTFIIEDEIEPARRALGNEGLKTAFNKAIPTLEGDEAEEFVRKADENVRLMRQRRCKNHVWRKDYLNGGKKCQVCGKTKEEPTRAKDVEP